MKKALIALTLTLSFTTAAHAGLDRTAVSLYGNDADPCSLTKPCATFARAISETNPGGELIALDNGGYDGFTVDRAMTITAAPGAVVTVGQEPGVTNWAIKVDAPGKRVMIRGLMVQTTGRAMGIVAHDAEATYIDDVYIEGSGCEAGCGTGIFGRMGDLYVHNTRIRNVFQGINHNPMKASTATITDVNIDNAGLHGIGIDNYGRATIRNTVVSHALRAYASGSLEEDGHPEMILIDCTATDSDTGVAVGNAARVSIERTAITRTVTGIHNTGGVIITHGNSMLTANGTDVVGPITTNAMY